MSRHALTNALASSRSCRSGAPAGHRRITKIILDALLWLGKTDAPWRDLPERYGPWRTVATRFYRWTRSRLWERVLAELRRIADAKGRHRGGGAHGRRPGRIAARRAKKGALPQALGRSRGGYGSKRHLRCDRRGRPMAFLLTAGHRHEQTAFRELMRRDVVKRSGRGRSKLRPRTVVGDRDYTRRPVRNDLQRHGISAVIPQLKTERTPRLMDWALYRERNVVEAWLAV